MSYSIMDVNLHKLREDKDDIRNIDIMLDENDISIKLFYRLVDDLEYICKHYNIDKNKLILFGSSYLAYNNIRDVNDLDIALDSNALSEVIDKLKNDYDIKEQTDAELKILTKNGELSFVDIEALPINPFIHKGSNINGINIINKDGWLEMKNSDPNKSDLDFDLDIIQTESFGLAIDKVHDLITGQKMPPEEFEKTFSKNWKNMLVKGDMDV